MDPLKIGRNLAALRKKAGLTQKQLADQIHVSDKAISKWENGKGIPDLVNLTQLAELYEISIEELLNPRFDQNNRLPFTDRFFIPLIFLNLFCLLVLIAALGVFRYTEIHGYEPLFDWIPLACRMIILLGLFAFSALLWSHFKKGSKLTSVLLIPFLLAGVLLTFKELPAIRRTIFSIGPQGKQSVVVKLDPDTGEAWVYRQRFFFFVKRHERIPYTVKDGFKLQWLADDICALTYNDPDDALHQYVATYGSRDSGISYTSMINALQGSWIMMDKNTSGWGFSADETGFTLTHGKKSEHFDYSDCVQFGTIALVLCRSGSPQYTITLDNDTVLNADDRVAKGKTMSITAVSREVSAPVQFTMISADPITPMVSEENSTVTKMKVCQFAEGCQYPVLQETEEDYYALALAAILDRRQALAVNGVDVEVQIVSMTVLAGDLDDFLVQIESEETASSSNSSETMVLNYKYRIMRIQDGWIYAVFTMNENGMEELTPLSLPEKIDFSQQKDYHFFVPAA